MQHDIGQISRKITANFDVEVTEGTNKGFLPLVAVGASIHPPTTFLAEASSASYAYVQLRRLLKRTFLLLYKYHQE